MADKSIDDTNRIMPRDNSVAPSLVLFDIDKDNGERPQQNAKSDIENQNLTAPDKSMTTSNNLTGVNNVSLLTGADNTLLGEMHLKSDNRGMPQVLPPSNNPLPDRRSSDAQRQQPLPTRYISPLMAKLQKIIETDSPRALTELVQKEQISDSEEAIILMYVAVVMMNTPGVFDFLLQKNQRFKTKPVWFVLFSMPNIFQVLQSSPTMAERQKFDELVLKVALEREITFMVDILLDNRTMITPAILSLLLLEEQQSKVTEMLARPIDERPIFISSVQSSLQKKNRNKRVASESTTKKLELIDVIESMIDSGVHSSERVFGLVMLMQNEVQRNYKRRDSQEAPIDGGGDDEKDSSGIDYEQLFKLFMMKRKVKLLRLMFTLDRKVFDFSPDLFLMALELEAYDMAALLFKEFFRVLREMTPQQLDQAITSIVQSYKKNNGMLDFKAYLVRQFIEQMQLRHARALLDGILMKVKIVSKQNILVMNLNVVKCSCLLIENLADLAQKFNQLQVRCQNLRKDIIIVAREFMTRVDSEYEMKYLLLEKDFEYRDSLDLITKLRIFEFLETQLAENVVKEIWRSPYATQDSILSASTNHKLTFKFWDCVRDLEFDQPFCKVKDVSQIEAHIFQFTVWRFSPKARMLQEFFVTFLFVYLVDTYINAFLDLIPPLEEFELQLFEMEGQLAAVTDTSSAEYLALEAKTQALQYYFEPLRLQFYEEMMMLTYVCFGVLFFAIQHIPEIIYTSITRRQFNAYSFKNLLDFVLFLQFFFFICISYGNNLNGSWKENLTIGEQTRADIYSRNFFSGQPRMEELLLLSCVLVISFRLFYLFIYNTMFGTLWGIVNRFLPELISYIMFYFVEVFFFGVIAELAFRRLQLYNTFENAFYTLFYSGFGFFDYDDFENETQFGYNFGLLFLLGFLISNLGLITSIFGAVIIVLYDEYYKHKSIFTMIETLKVRSVMQADKEYSALISLPPPLNGLLFFLGPFLMTSKNPEVINKAILWVTYLPLLVLTFGVFMAYNLALIPVTYIKMFFHKMIMIFVYSKSYRVSRADKFMLWILFIVIGPVRLINNFLVDMIAFVKHCTLQELKKTKVQIREKPLDKQTIRMISLYFKQRNERLIPFKQAAGEIRDQMSIFQKIGQIFVPQPLINFLHGKVQTDSAKPELLGESDFQVVFDQVREYSTVKQIMHQNCEQVVYNKQRVKSLDCQIMSVLFEDILRHKTVAKMEDENYIFIRRAMDVKTKAAIERREKERAKLGSDVVAYVENPKTNVDFEDHYKREKRMKHAVRKLVNARTSRILAIIGYSSTEKDAKRLEYAIKTFSSDNLYLQRKLTQMSYSQNERGSFSRDAGQASLRTFFGAEGGKALEDKIMGLSMGFPKIDNDINRMQQEIQILVERYTEANKAVQGAQNRQKLAVNTIQELKKEMNELRGGNVSDGDNSLRKFIQNDYFYKELSGKPKVSFAPQVDGADPVDSIMDRRPIRKPGGSALKKSQRSFVTNANLVRSQHEEQEAQPGAGQGPQSDQQAKKKTISLAQLKKVSVLQQQKVSVFQQVSTQNRMSGVGEQYNMLQKPGEDSDVPYISDTSGM